MNGRGDIRGYVQASPNERMGKWGTIEGLYRSDKRRHRDMSGEGSQRN